MKWKMEHEVAIDLTHHTAAKTFCVNYEDNKQNYMNFIALFYFWKCRCRWRWWVRRRKLIDKIQRKTFIHCHDVAFISVLLNSRIFFLYFLPFDDTGINNDDYGLLFLSVSVSLVSTLMFTLFCSMLSFVSVSEKNLFYSIFFFIFSLSFIR